MGLLAPPQLCLLHLLLHLTRPGAARHHFLPAPRLSLPRIGYGLTGQRNWQTPVRMHYAVPLLLQLYTTQHMYWATSSRQRREVSLAGVAGRCSAIAPLLAEVALHDSLKASLLAT